MLQLFGGVLFLLCFASLACHAVDVSNSVNYADAALDLKSQDALEAVGVTGLFEHIVSSWNDQVLELDALTRCIKESRAEHAVDRWLDCVESLEARNAPLRSAQSSFSQSESESELMREPDSTHSMHGDLPNHGDEEVVPVVESSTEATELRASTPLEVPSYEPAGEGTEKPEFENPNLVWTPLRPETYGEENDESARKLLAHESESELYAGGTESDCREVGSNMRSKSPLEEINSQDPAEEKVLHSGMFEIGDGGSADTNSETTLLSDPASQFAQGGICPEEPRTAVDGLADMKNENGVITSDQGGDGLDALKVAACIGAVVTLLLRKRPRARDTLTSANSSQLDERGSAMTGYLSGHEHGGQVEVLARSLPVPLGMAIATVIAEVLEQQHSSLEGSRSADELTKLLEAAMKEELLPIMGSEFTGFVDQFKQTFRRTYRLISSVRSASKKLPCGPMVNPNGSSHKRSADGSPGRLAAVEGDTGVSRTKYTRVTRVRSSSDVGFRRGFQENLEALDLEWDLAERFRRMTFSSQNGEQEAESKNPESSSGCRSQSKVLRHQLDLQQEETPRCAEISSERQWGVGVPDRKLPHYGGLQSTHIGPDSEGEFSFVGVKDLDGADGLTSKSFRQVVSAGKVGTQGEEEVYNHERQETDVDSRWVTKAIEPMANGLMEGGVLALENSACSSGSLPSTPSHSANRQLQGMRFDFNERDPAIGGRDAAYGEIPGGRPVGGTQQDAMILSAFPLQGTAAGNLQQDFLHVLKKSVEVQEHQNYLKSVELVHRMKHLSLDEEHLQLSSESNQLMRENVDLSRVKAKFRENEVQDRKMAMAYSELSRTCADELVAGLSVMLCALFYGCWKYSHARLYDVVLTCQPAVYELSNSMIPGINRVVNSLNILMGQFQMFICQVTVASRMFVGLGIISIVAASLLRKSVTSSSQAMPATILIIVLGGVCGLAGKFAVDSMGGSGYHWVLMWEALCLVHACATCFTPFLFWLLNGTLDRPFEKRRHQIVSPLLRQFVFHVSLVLIIPAMAGLLPFAPFREVLLNISSTIFNIVLSPLDSDVRERARNSLVLN